MKIFIPFYVLDSMVKVANDVPSETKINELDLDEIYDVNSTNLSKIECDNLQINLTKEEILNKFEELKNVLSNSSNKVDLCNEFHDVLSELNSEKYNPFVIGFLITNNKNMPQQIVIEDLFHLLNDIKLIKSIGPITNRFGQNDDLYVKHEYEISLNFIYMKVIG